MSYRYLLILSILLSLVLIPATSSASGSVVKFTSHDIRVRVDVPTQKASIADGGEIEVSDGWNLMYLPDDAAISVFRIGGQSTEYEKAHASDTARFPDDLKAAPPEMDIEGNPLVVFFKSADTGQVSFEIQFDAKFDDPVEGTRFSHENVGNEVSGTILDLGAYLSPSCYYYPRGDEKLASFRLTADIPATWHCIADGNLISSELNGGRRVESWGNPYVNDGCMFMAAPYVVESSYQDGIKVECYFFEADTSLAHGYLDATKEYLRMYTEMIGFYPFERFTVAENFFPTGYGMPAWTLLGQQVLRLPFIKATSLGHEVLHNWWGNSVYVDYDRGNWCEGATVYGADYHYKLNQSEQAAKDYRKDILKAYDSYVNEGNDFPIREFVARHSAGTRVIGYSKAMMVYHMVEQEIGSEAFWAAWKLVYENYRAKQISWEEWVGAFEEISGTDLSWVIPQWIDRTGAPRLGVGFGRAERAPGYLHNTLVPLELTQDADPPYRLPVPIRFTYDDGTVVDTTVLFDRAKQPYGFNMPGLVHSVEVDPDYHIFRKLYPQEIEAIVSSVMGAEKRRFVADGSAEELAAFQEFAVNVDDETATVDPPEILDQENKAFAPILLNPVLSTASVAPLQMTMTDSTITIDGTEYPRAGHTFVLALKKVLGFEDYLAVLTSDYESLPRLGQLIPHYGKYSYLVFEGTRNVGKGQWLTTGSPLEYVLDSNH